MISSASSSVDSTWLLLLVLLLALLLLAALLLLWLLLLLLWLLLLLMDALSCVAWAMISSKSSAWRPLLILDFPGIANTGSSCREEAKYSRMSTLVSTMRATQRLPRMDAIYNIQNVLKQAMRKEQRCEWKI
jgi:hypothetical protein